jgi:hypothetical protein
MPRQPAEGIAVRSYAHSQYVHVCDPSGDQIGNTKRGDHSHGLPRDQVPNVGYLFELLHRHRGEDPCPQTLMQPDQHGVGELSAAG